MIGLVVDLFVADVRMGHCGVVPYEVADAVNADMIEGGYAVDVHEASVKYGDGHVAATQSDGVQAMSVEAFYLVFAVTIVFLLDGVPGVEVFMVFLIAQFLVDRVGRQPNKLRLADKG